MPTDRRTIRRWIGRVLGEGLVLTASASSAATQIIDANRLSRENGTLKDYEVIATGGTAANLGQVRRVASSDKGTTSVTLAAALPAPVAVADEFELWNERGYGITVDAVHDAINFVIDAVKELNPSFVTTDTTFDRTSPYLSVPAEWDWLYGLEWVDDDNYSVRRPAPWNQMDVDPLGRTVRFRGLLGRRADAKTVRLRGGIDAQPLLSDDDETIVDAEWLVKSVVALVSFARAHRTTDPAAAERKVNFMEGMVAPLRTKAWQRQQGRAWRLR